MKRREFLALGMAAGLASVDHRANAASDKAEIMTVRGPIAPSEFGRTLPHEHVMVDFAGADKVGRDRYDADEVYRVSLPHLKRSKEAGIRSLVECTPAYLARDPALLLRLSEASGLHLLTNTGYYAANGGKHVPKHARDESAEAIAARWLGEWRDGIEGTGIRPGFMKIGTDAGPLPEVNRKLVRAAARTHLASGLTIAAHTGNGIAAMEQLDILKEEGVEPSAFIWVHANAETDRALHARAAERGAWVEFDGIAPGSVDQHVELVHFMKEKGLLGKVLVSHDAGWYHVGEKGGGEFRGFNTLTSEFLPALKAVGFTASEIDRLLVDNPRSAFTIRKRAAR